MSSEMRSDQERVHAVLVKTISMLCKKGLDFERSVRIEGVIGITVDDRDIFIVHVNDLLTGNDDIHSETQPGRHILAKHLIDSQPFSQSGLMTPTSEPHEMPPSSPLIKEQARRQPFTSPHTSASSNHSFSSFSPARIMRGTPQVERGSSRLSVPYQQGSSVAPSNGPFVGSPIQLRSQGASVALSIRTSTSPCYVGNSPNSINTVAPACRSSTRNTCFHPAKLYGSDGLKLPGACKSKFENVDDSPGVILVEDDDPTDADEKSIDTKLEEDSVGDSKILASSPQSEPDALPIPVGPISRALDPVVEETHQQTQSSLKKEVDSASVLGSKPDPSVGSSGAATECREETIVPTASFETTSMTVPKPQREVDYFLADYESCSDVSFDATSDDEDWKMEPDDAISDPDWSDSETQTKKAKTSGRNPASRGGGSRPKATAISSGRGGRVASKRGPSSGIFTEVPPSLLKSCSSSSNCGGGGGTDVGGTEEPWKLVARYVCNVSDCGVSFSQKYNLLRHQRVKHGMGTSRKRSVRSASRNEEPGCDEAQMNVEGDGEGFDKVKFMF